MSDVALNGVGGGWVVHASEYHNTALSNLPDFEYDSPPHGRHEDALVLAQMLTHGAAATGTPPWSCAVAGGRLTVTVEQQSPSHSGEDRDEAAPRRGQGSR